MLNMSARALFFHSKQAILFKFIKIDPVNIKDYQEKVEIILYLQAYFEKDYLLYSLPV